MKNLQNLFVGSANGSAGSLKAIRFCRLFVAMMTIVMTFILISPNFTVAAVSDEGKKISSEVDRSKLKATIMDDLRNKDGRKQFTHEELEEMRSAMIDLLHTVEFLTKLREAHNGFGEKSKNQDYESLKEQIQNMSAEDLNVLRTALDPSKMKAQLAKSRDTLNAYKDRAAKTSSLVSTNSAGFPEVDPYCDDIPTTAEYKAALIGLIVAEGVRDAAQNGCNEVIVAVGFGGNGRLACLITDAIYIGVKAATFDTTFCYDDYTGALTAANYNRLDHIHGDLEEVKSSNSESFNNIINNAATNTTTLTTAITTAKNTIVNNDNSNTQSIVNNAATNTTTITTALTTGITNAQNTIVNNDNTNKTTIINNDNQNATTLNTNLTTAKNTIVANDNTNTTSLLNNASANTTNLLNNANTNTANIISNDNANKNAIINNDNANTTALTDLILRLQIEADLSTEPNAVKVGFFMIPTAFGGKLDLVQQIVTQTLARIVAAGGNIGNAQSFLNQANADKAAGNFKAAYDNYRRAYKAAVN
jgi:hypothetical protein